MANNLARVARGFDDRRDVKEKRAKDLLVALNATAHSARALWISFLVVLAYMTVTVAGVKDLDLLLGRPIRLPILQTEVGLTGFFLFSPGLLLLLHFGILVQLVLLAQKCRWLNEYLGDDSRNHPLRKEVSSFFVVQTLSAPEYTSIFRAMLLLTGWLTLGLFPLLVLIFFEIRYLPAHEEIITGVHQFYILSDAALAATLGVLRRYPERTFLVSLQRFMSRRYTALAEALTVWIAAPLFAYFAATVPDSSIERYWLTTPGLRTLCQPVKVQNPGRNSGREACQLTALLFERRAGDDSGTPPLSRSLVVTNTIVVPEAQWEPRGPSYRFRDRDFRYARFDGSNLRRADFSNSDLSFASLASTDLSGAHFSEYSLAEGADFSDSTLKEANINGLDLDGAKLINAELQGTILGRNLRGADFSDAALDGSYIYGEATGAIFRNATLVGLDVRETRLTGADFTAAQLAGARFGEVDLGAASLSRANIWQTSLGKASILDTDFHGATLRRLTPDEVGYVTPEPERVKRRPSPRLSDALDQKKTDAWVATSEHESWQALLASADKRNADEYRKKLTDILIGLACDDKGAFSWVARSILRRGGFIEDVAGQRQISFNGNPEQLYLGLSSTGCEGGKRAYEFEAKLFDDLLEAVMIWKHPPS